MLGRNRASSTHHLLEANSSVRIVHSTSFPAGQGMTQGTSYLPANIRHNLIATTTINSRSPMQAGPLVIRPSLAFAVATAHRTIMEQAEGKDDSFATINSRYNGFGLGSEFPTLNDPFIPEDSPSDSIIAPATPRRPDSPYPAASIGSSARSARSLSSPRTPLSRLHSFTALPNIPPPIMEDAVSSTDATVAPSVPTAHTGVGVGASSTPDLKAAMRFAPGAKFMGGHFRMVKKKGLLSHWLRRVVSSSSCSGRSDGPFCSECGWEWRAQSYGKRCGSGVHFQDGQGKMYVFVGENFLFEEEEKRGEGEEERVEGSVFGRVVLGV